MLSHKAIIQRGEDKVSLILSIGEINLLICLTDDNPIEVKSVFNKLILELKKGKFNFALTDEKQDLYYHLCNEYINQLNGEIADVYSQLKKNNLIENPAEK